MISWTNERTFFNSEETCTILACMFLAFGNTVTDILTRSKYKISQNALSVHDVKNTQAPQRKGNLLEVSTAISIVDASQHYSKYLPEVPFNYDIFSLGGQDGTTFFKNLLVNLINLHCAIKGHFILKLSFEQCRFNLQNFFNNLKVPFLYSLNRDDKFLDRLNNSSNSVYLKKFERTANSEGIDGKYEIKYRRQKKFTVVECKNWKDQISTTILEKIVTKCANVENSILFFVFCDFIVSEPTLITKFTKTCDEKKVNVYRLEKLGKTFNIVPFYEKHLGPKHICIILEFRVINLENKII